MNYPSLSDIKSAHQRISSFIRHTPIITSTLVNELTGAQVFFKCENFQKTGSFKIRGASNAIFSILPEDRIGGFATHSSGNHAQAVAYAAHAAGVDAHIVMPKNAPKVKINAVKNYGGKITFCEPIESERIRTCNEIIAKTGATFISPFEHRHIIEGQATAAKELIEDTPDLDVILAPVGGGGLAAGTSLSTKYISPTTKVMLGEPEMADDTFRSFEAGKVIPLTSANTIADGLKVTVGKLNLEIIKSYVSEVITVTEEEIVDAMRIIWERMKIVVEPSSAVPFAAVLKRKEQFNGQKIGIIVSGGNVDLGNLPF